MVRSLKPRLSKYLRKVPTFVGAHTFCVSPKAWFRRHAHAGLKLTQSSKVPTYTRLKAKFFYCDPVNFTELVLKPRTTQPQPQIVNQQRVVYRFQCDLCDAGYVCYTRAHLHTRVDGHKQKVSSVYKHYHEQHSEVPEDLLRRFSVRKKCRNKFDCLVNEMLFIRDLKPTLNVQSG